MNAQDLMDEAMEDALAGALTHQRRRIIQANAEDGCALLDGWFTLAEVKALVAAWEAHEAEA